MRVSLLSGLLVLVALLTGARAAEPAIALKAARLFDGKSKTLLQNAVVIVQGDKIVDLGSNLAIPSGAKVIELGDATLSPGFMDAHTHLTLDYSGNYNERRLNEVDLNVSEQAIKAVGWARDTIEAGFTTVRDLGSRFVGSKEFVDVALRNSINKGVIVGPVFATCCSVASPITAKESRTGRMRFAKPSASK
jgi:imidazolonepropionase-like amidohydrolase